LDSCGGDTTAGFSLPRRTSLRQEYQRFADLADGFRHFGSHNTGPSAPSATVTILPG